MNVRASSGHARVNGAYAPVVSSLQILPPWFVCRLLTRAAGAPLEFPLASSASLTRRVLCFQEPEMGSFVSMEVACKTSCDEKVWIEGFTSLRAAQGDKSNANVFFASMHCIALIEEC